MSAAAAITRIAVEGELTIYRALELKDQLLAPLAEAGATGAIEVDLSAVSEIDTAGVQLLMLARRDTVAGQRDWRLVAPSPAVVEAFELLDLTSHFGVHVGAHVGAAAA